MTDHTNLSDDELLRLLQTALAGSDPVPADVVAMAKAAPDLAGLDLELAQLVHDSAHDLAGVRGSGSGRQLDFTGGDADLVVVVAPAVDAVGGTEIAGQLVPGVVADVELLQAGTVVRTAISDELGRFRVADLPAGPLRLRVRAVRLLTPPFEGTLG